MREAFFNKALLRLDSGDVFGVNLGADYCAEHEWGIKRLKGRFGLEQGLVRGVEGRQVTRNGDQVMYFSGKRTRTIDKQTYTFHFAVLATRKENVDEAAQKAHLLRHLHVGSWSLKKIQEEGCCIVSAWDEGDFRLELWTLQKQELAPMQELHEAFLRHDACISMGAALNPFDRGGLCLSIASKVPQALREHVLAADEDAIALQEAADATGIARELEQAGKRYYSLSPRWADKADRAAGVIFWLNPCEQGLYQANWYTVEQLRDWIGGKGPVGKSKESVCA